MVHIYILHHNFEIEVLKYFEYWYTYAPEFTIYVYLTLKHTTTGMCTHLVHTRLCQDYTN